MESEHELEVVFEPIDVVEMHEANELISALDEEGVEARVVQQYKPGKGMLEVAALVAIIAVSTASAGSLAIIAAFIYRVFRTGITLDLTGPKPKVRKNPKLPRGSLLTIAKDGTAELREGIAADQIGNLLKEVLTNQATMQGGGANAS
jgi:hypothetical protein